MKSEANTVGDYFLEIPEKRIQALNKLRQLCLKHLPGHEESMAYKMPSYKRDGQVEGKSKQIDLSSFSKGIYFITLRSKEFVRTEKIIKL